MKKFIVAVVLLGLGAVVGGAAGYKLGVEYGKKATIADGQLRNTHQTAVVDLNTLNDAKPAPAPAPAAPMESAAAAETPVNTPAPAEAAAPAPAADAVTYTLSLDDTFIDFIGYKT
ncbi:MAG TPA: hypothetical protein PKL54_12630, partial [Candidatus Hydrogenedentes bacterium]|nr:hypothetical protein [Candidatus Hydrogenedentota bacterium]